MNPNHEDLIKWVNHITILDENIYLPEYEIRMKKDNIRLQAKYDFNLDFNIELYKGQCKYCDFACGSHVCDA